MADDTMVQGPFRNLERIILASASPRRQKLLASLGMAFEIQPSLVSEPPPAPGSDPVEHTMANACLKAEDIAGRAGSGIIIGADTVVVLEGEILGKPADSADALETLKRLSGQTHEVITGCCLIRAGGQSIRSFHVRTSVSMDRTPPALLHSYVATGEAADKAGSYAIQGVGAFLVREINGSYTNVVGLPLNEVCLALLAAGAIRYATPDELVRSGEDADLEKPSSYLIDSAQPSRQPADTGPEADS